MSKQLNIKRYRHRPSGEVVEAVQVGHGVDDLVADWVNGRPDAYKEGYRGNAYPDFGVSMPPFNGLKREYARWGDWVVRGEQSGFFVVVRESFGSYYTELPGVGDPELLLEVLLRELADVWAVAYDFGVSDHRQSMEYEGGMTKPGRVNPYDADGRPTPDGRELATAARDSLLETFLVEYRDLDDGHAGYTVYADGSFVPDIKPPTREKRWMSNWVHHEPFASDTDLESVRLRLRKFDGDS